MRMFTARLSRPSAPTTARCRSTRWGGDCKRNYRRYYSGKLDALLVDHATAVLREHTSTASPPQPHSPSFPLPGPEEIGRRLRECRELLRTDDGAIAAFLSRKQVGRNWQWPTQGWYNDLAFCQAYHNRDALAHRSVHSRRS